MGRRNHAGHFLLKRIRCVLHIRLFINTLRTGDADLRLYITTVQDG